jgi:hypothetical protein
LFDTSSGVYWAVDSFGTPLPHEVANIDELDPEFWREGFNQFSRLVSPWHRWLDPAKYHAHLERLQRLGFRTVANAHGPAIYGRQVDAGFELLRELPSLPEAELPNQADLEAIMAAVTTAA